MSESLHPIARDTALHQLMQTWRRQIHQHPELAYEEFKTSQFVAEQLTQLGLTVHTGLGGTGIVGVLQGTQGEGAHIALRADKDALPLVELNSFAHKSCHHGKMHGCGHDGHTTMLLGAATALAAQPNFKGTVYFIFQPAEEGGASAKRMIEDGLFSRFPIEQVYGMHNWPGVASGQFAVHAGAVMASTDSFELSLTGKGGHGAMPDTTIDPVVTAAQIITATQSIVARNLNPTESGVISITQVQAGTGAYNVIPEQVLMRGTIRSLNEPNRQLLTQRFQQIIEHTAAAFNTQAHLQFNEGYPATINTPAEAAVCRQVAASLVGDANVQWNPPPSMGAEDFAYMLQQRPGAYIWIGNGDLSESRALHNPYYDFNDAILALGASYWVKLVRTILY